MREELIWEVQRMLRQRCMYFQKREKWETDEKLKRIFAGQASAYKSACDILLAGVLGEEEILKEFDYYAD